MCGLPWWLSGKKICMTMQEIWVWSLGWEDSLEEEMATHSSILGLEKSHELRSLVGSSPWGHKELVTAGHSTECDKKWPLTLSWSVGNTPGGVVTIADWTTQNPSEGGGWFYLPQGSFWPAGMWTQNSWFLRFSKRSLEFRFYVRCSNFEIIVN